MTDLLLAPTTNLHEIDTWSRIINSIPYQNPLTDIGRLARTTSFVTVTVDGGGERPKPGDNSWHMPMVLMGMLGEKYEEGGTYQEHYEDGMVLYSHKVVDAKAGFKPW